MVFHDGAGRSDGDRRALVESVLDRIVAGVRLHTLVPVGSIGDDVREAPPKDEAIVYRAIGSTRQHWKSTWRSDARQ